MQDYFPEYTGGNNYDAACAFLLDKFVSLNQSPSKSVYAHYTGRYSCASRQVTCTDDADATDTRGLAFVLSAVK